jgi:arylsulfatase A-like enzyme
VLGNRPPQGGYEKLRPTAGRTLPVWLSRAGYDTIHIGKYLNGYGARTPATEVPPGWTEWHGSVDPFTYRMWGYRLNEGGVVRQYGRPARREPAALPDRRLPRQGRGRDPPPRAQRQALYLSVAFLAPHAESAAGPQAAPVRSAPRHRGTFANEPVPRPPSYDEADVSDKPAVLAQAYGPA